MIRERPYLPPHWPTGEPFPWPEWERTCPGCGRYHRNWHFSGGERSVCAWCDWKGYLPVTRTVAGDGGGA